MQTSDNESAKSYGKIINFSRYSQFPFSDINQTKYEMFSHYKKKLIVNA